MVIQQTNSMYNKANGSNLTNSSESMLRQGGFFSKSRHAPVSSMDLKRNAVSGAELPPSSQHRTLGFGNSGPQSATGANLQPLGIPNHHPQVQQALNPNDATQQQGQSAPSSQNLPALSSQVKGGTPAGGAGETFDKESRDGTKPRKSVMRKVIGVMNIGAVLLHANSFES